MRPVAVHEDDEVVRVADDSPSRQAMDAASTAQIGRRHRPAGPPGRMQVLIEHRQRDVSQQRGKDAALRRPGQGALAVAALSEDTGFEERLDQGSTRLSLTR